MERRSRTERVHRLAFDVDWPPGHVACYLVDGPEPVLVDASVPGATDEFRAALAGHDLEPADVEHLVVTHPHVDHVGQVRTVLEGGNPTVYAPAGVRARWARDPDALEDRVRRNAREAGFTGDLLEQAVDQAVESLRRDSDLLPADAVDVWVEPGDTVDVGTLEVEAVHTPGHQADHLSYLTTLGDETALFAGDAAIQPFRPVLLHDGLDDGYVDAVEAFEAGLDRLASLSVDRIYPGHGPVHDDLQAIVRRDRESLVDRLDRVEHLVDSGYATVPDVAVALAGDRDVRYMVPEAMSVLARLEALGRVESEQTDGVRHYNT